MDHRLLKHFLHYGQLSEDEIAAIDGTMDIRHVTKGTLLLQEGQSSNEVYFVLEGIIRQFYLVDGAEKTSDFFTEEQWVLSENNFSGKQASGQYLECCSDCVLMVGNSTKGEDLYALYPNLGTISRKLMEAVFIQQQAKLEAFVTGNPQSRYLNLLKNNPGLFQRVPLYQIASYIGVTPESLSRIRRRIKL